MKRPHPAMRRRKSEPQRSAVVIYLIVHKYFLFFCLLKKKEKEKKNSSLLNSINRQVHVSSIIPHSTDADEYKLTWLTPKEPDESLNDLITILIVALLKVSNKAIIKHLFRQVFEVAGFHAEIPDWTTVIADRRRIPFRNNSPSGVLITWFLSTRDQLSNKRRKRYEGSLSCFI